LLDQPTSRSLIRRVQAQDADAWESFAQLYGPIVYSWTRREGLNDVDSSDVTQDVFRRLLGHIDRFGYRTTESTFRGWLRTVTRNEVRMFWRRAEQHVAADGGSAARQVLEQAPEKRAIPELPENEDDEPRAAAQLAQRAIELIKVEFERNTWQAFWRVVVDGQPATEVAAELGLSPGAVRQAKYRVLCRVRELLGEE
jgi:RNA polymerase sigma-70 factor (ECF subfamily)